MIGRKFKFLLFTFYSLLFNFAYAKEITILYTGSTHAMLYPCSCPVEQDGGLTRRATLIKQLRQDNPDTLVLDSGGFFAGGFMDEYSQNTELDGERTLVNLKAMEFMKYDALGVGGDEFYFGRKFLEEKAAKLNLAFLSCNILATDRPGLVGRELLKPYIIKEISGVKIGIIGVTSLSAMPKAIGLNFIEPEVAVKKAVETLKKNNADIIILLSNLGEDADTALIKDIKGIDIIITNYSTQKAESAIKIDSTLVLKPSWQGRRLGKLTLTIENNQITDYKTEELRLSNKISDDSEIRSILPSCFSDGNCKKEGLIGKCQNPGTAQADCQFQEPAKIKLLILTPKFCITCDTEKVVNLLKQTFPGLVVSYIYYPNPKANTLIKSLNIDILPIYLLGKEIEKEKGFDNLKDSLEIKGDFYMLKPQQSGISYFLDREKKKNKLDLFISLYDKNNQELLDRIKDFNPTIHFLVIEQKENEFDAANGNLEVEEDLRAVCVQKYYPDRFFDYINCRSKNINSSWWQDCLGAGSSLISSPGLKLSLGGLDIGKIENCAKGLEGKSLLRENIRLNKELRVMFGPAYLLDNQEIFSTKSVPTKEEFRKIFNIK